MKDYSSKGLPENIDFNTDGDIPETGFEEVSIKNAKGESQIVINCMIFI